MPEGKEDTFREELHTIADRLKHAPGGTSGSGQLYELDSEIEQHLRDGPDLPPALRERLDSKERLRFIMFAKWASLSDYEKVIRASAEAPSKRISFVGHGAYYRLAAEYTGSTMKNVLATQPFTFINLVEVKTGKEEDFRSEWSELAERRKDAPGFLSGRLYEVDANVEGYLSRLPALSPMFAARINSEPSFRFVIIVEWRSRSDYEEALRSYGKGKAIPFPSHPGFFRTHVTP